MRESNVPSASDVDGQHTWRSAIDTARRMQVNRTRCEGSVPCNRDTKDIRIQLRAGPKQKRRMLQWLKGKFDKTPDDPAKVEQDELAKIRGYPPPPEGLKPVRPIALVKHKEDLVDRLRDALTGLSRIEFDNMMIPTLTALGGLIDQLPASETDHHSGSLGLWTHSLEVGLRAAKLSNMRILDNHGDPEQRRLREPRWHVATALVGLFHDCAKVFDMTVYNAGGTLHWDPMRYGSVYEWATEHQIERYYWVWNKNRRKGDHEKLAAVLFGRLVSRDLQAWLGQLVFPEIISALHGEAESRCTEFVMSADRQSVKEDNEQRHKFASNLGKGVDASGQVLAVMADLMSEKRWTFNSPGSRAWLLDMPGEAGLFVVWGRGYEELIREIEERQIPSIPRRPEKLARALIHDWKVAQAFTDGEGNVHDLWIIEVPASSKGDPIQLKCLKLTSGNLAFMGVTLPKPITGTIIDPSTSGPAAAAVAAAPTPAAPSPAPAGPAPAPTARASQTTAPSPTAAPSPAPSTNSSASPAAPPSPPPPSVPPEEEPEGEENEKPPAKVVPRKPAGKGVSGLFSKGGLDATAAASLLDEKWGDAGKLILKIAQDARARNNPWTRTLAKEEGSVLIPFPGGLKSYLRWGLLDEDAPREPAAVIKIFLEAGVLDVDPLSPYTHARQVGGTHGLVLSKQIASLVAAVIEGPIVDAPPEEVIEPVPAVPETNVASASPAQQPVVAKAVEAPAAPKTLPKPTSGKVAASPAPASPDQQLTVEMLKKAGIQRDDGIFLSFGQVRDLAESVGDMAPIADVVKRAKKLPGVEGCSGGILIPETVEA